MSLAISKLIALFTGSWAYSINPSIVPTITPCHEANIASGSINESKSIFTYKGKDYKIIEVDGGDLSGHREANVAVNIGYGAREYWGLTNENGQLVYVIADKIILAQSLL